MLRRRSRSILVAPSVAFTIQRRSSDGPSPPARRGIRDGAEAAVRADATGLSSEMRISEIIPGAPPLRDGTFGNAQPLAEGLAVGGNFKQSQHRVGNACDTRGRRQRLPGHRPRFARASNSPGGTLSRNTREPPRRSNDSDRGNRARPDGWQQLVRICRRANDEQKGRRLLRIFSSELAACSLARSISSIRKTRREPLSD